MGGELLGIELGFVLHLKPFFIIMIAVVGTVLFSLYKTLKWYFNKGK